MKWSARGRSAGKPSRILTESLILVDQAKKLGWSIVRYDDEGSALFEKSVEGDELYSAWNGVVGERFPFGPTWSDDDYFWRAVCTNQLRDMVQAARGGCEMEELLRKSLDAMCSSDSSRKAVNAVALAAMHNMDMTLQQVNGQNVCTRDSKWCRELMREIRACDSLRDAAHKIMCIRAKIRSMACENMEQFLQAVGSGREEFKVSVLFSSPPEFIEGVPQHLKDDFAALQRDARKCARHICGDEISENRRRGLATVFDARMRHERARGKAIASAGPVASAPASASARPVARRRPLPALLGGRKRTGGGGGGGDGDGGGGGGGDGDGGMWSLPARRSGLARLVQSSRDGESGGGAWDSLGVDRWDGGSEEDEEEMRKDAVRGSASDAIDWSAKAARFGKMHALGLDPRGYDRRIAEVEKSVDEEEVEYALDGDEEDSREEDDDLDLGFGAFDVDRSGKGKGDKWDIDSGDDSDEESSFEDWQARRVRS